MVFKSEKENNMAGTTCQRELVPLGGGGRMQSERDFISKIMLSFGGYFECFGFGPFYVNLCGSPSLACSKRSELTI